MVKAERGGAQHALTAVSEHDAGDMAVAAVAVGDGADAGAVAVGEMHVFDQDICCVVLDADVVVAPIHD